MADYTGTNDLSQWDTSRPALTEQGENCIGQSIQEVKRITQAVIEKEHGSDGSHAASSIVTGYIIDGAITTAKIADGAVTTDKLAPGSVTTAVLADGDVTTTKIADVNVTTAKIADNAITADKIAATAILPTKLGGATQGQFLIGQTSGAWLPLVLSGGITVNPTTGAVTLNQATVKIATIQDLKADGVDGGTFTSGSLVTRDLNSVNDPAGLIVALSSSKFTLGFGHTYMLWAEVPAYVTGDHQAVLYDETNSAILLPGSNSSNGNASPATTRSIVLGYIDLSTATVNNQYSIKHQCSVTEATDGLGKHSSFTVTSEVYTQLMIIQLT